MKQRIFVINLATYGRGNTHIYCINLDDEKKYNREKFKGYLCRDLWINDQVILDKVGVEDLGNWEVELLDVSNSYDTKKKFNIKSILVEHNKKVINFIP